MIGQDLQVLVQPERECEPRHLHTIRKSTSCSDPALSSSSNLSLIAPSDTAAGSWLTSFSGCTKSMDACKLDSCTVATVRSRV